MAVKKKKSTASSSSKKLRVRMYRVGMGDCFLVTVPDGKKGKHILIDCGVHSQSQFKALPDAVKQMVKDTEGNLAVVVATHAHADHISGFGTESETFEQMTIGQVWLPWFEDLSNPAAKKLHKAAAALTAQLESRAARLAAAGDSDPLMDWVLNNASGSFFGAAGRSSEGNNAKALKLLRGGFGDKRKTKYLKAGMVMEDAGGIDGLTVTVLAPSGDEKFLSKMHPPDNQLYGLAAHGNLFETGSEETYKPFGEQAGGAPAGLDAAFQQRVATQVAIPWTALALSVDNYLNNTSLSLLLQYKGKTLLFPGDAQWGNWMSWEDNWESILGDISFYKVGHHGSHNATPKGALHLMENASAMASTDTVKSFNRGHFPVPYPKLVAEVKKTLKNRYAQSDELGAAPKQFKAGPVVVIGDDKTKTSLYCDYEL